jgi:uncharacterized RmlC-like cupin family protein
MSLLLPAIGTEKEKQLMTALQWKQDPVPTRPGGEDRVVKPLQFDGHTPQTGGMHRLAAVSHLLVGSEKLWAGVMMADPNTASNVHHHGPQQTVVYVTEGMSKLRWGHRLEHEAELEAGDFLFIPPYMPHQEINPSPDQPALWIVVRSGPEAVVVDLTLGADGEFVSPDWRQEPTKNDLAGVQALLLAIVVFLGAVVGDLWLWHGRRGWPVLLCAVLLVLVGVLAIRRLLPVRVQ